MNYNKFILSLDSDHKLLGKKTSMISQISRISQNENSFFIPGSIVISTEFFYEFLEYNNAKSIFDVNWNNAKIPADFTSALISKIREVFGNSKLVVRSSATCEDSPLFSFAGQYQSVLDLFEEHEIINAIILCYKSFASENAKLYSSYNKIDIACESMGILIQEMIPVNESGVLFTVNPITGEKEYLLESTYGIGTKVVSGCNDRACIRLNKNELDTYNPLYRELVKVSEILENYFGYYLDIEWGFSQEKIYIFQARPVILCRKIEKEHFNKPGICKAKGNSISNNVTVGKLINIDKDGFSKGNIVIYNNKKLDNYKICELIKSRGIVLLNGGVLSHFANIIREFNKPCISISQDSLEDCLGKIAVLDADIGEIFLLDELNAYQKFNYLWNAVLSLNLDNINKFGVEKNKFESVIFDIDEDMLENELIKNNITKTYDSLQSIYTFDFKDKALAANDSYIRIKQSKTDIKIQFKRYSFVNEKCRNEVSLILDFASLDESINFLQSFGLMQTGYQERTIKTYSNDEVNFNITIWPNSKPFVGIESYDKGLLNYYCRLANLDEREMVYTDGKGIFERLKLKLDDCRFAAQ